MPHAPLLRFTVIEHPQGRILLISSRIGLARVLLGASEQTIEKLNMLADVSPNVVSKRRGKPLNDLQRMMKHYFSGKRTSFTRVDVDFGDSTSFQKNVWELTAKIPYGSVRSYGWLARELGDPGCARAVGQALARNPVPIVIPCHRIIEESGRRGGFAAGQTWKGHLLGLEGGEQRLRWRERRKRS